jgi:pimeloyl-ACP methyl ester carboxylesterase
VSPPGSGSVRSFDGTRLAATRFGSGVGSPLLVVNAIGATPAVWRAALGSIEPERPILCWDHRGLHGSSAPASERLDPAAHAEDALAVLDHFEVARAVAVSWSNGGRIALELVHRYPERVAALAMVCGGYGGGLDRVVRHLDPAGLLPALAGVAKQFAPLVQSSLRALVSRPEIAGLVRQSGLVGVTADTAAIVERLRALAECDARTLLASYEAVAGDAAPQLFGDIHVPVLLVAGGRDPFARVAVAEEMAHSLPTARLEVYEGATHFLPLEFPARLGEHLRQFFAETTSS